MAVCALWRKLDETSTAVKFILQKSIVLMYRLWCYGDST